MGRSRFGGKQAEYAVYVCTDEECGYRRLEEWLPTTGAPRYCPHHRRRSDPHVEMERIALVPKGAVADG